MDWNHVLLGVVLGTLALYVVAFILSVRIASKLGHIHCRRCGHIGGATGFFVPFWGVRVVCSKCKGDHWVTHS